MRISRSSSRGELERLRNETELWIFAEFDGATKAARSLATTERQVEEIIDLYQRMQNTLVDHFSVKLPKE